VDIGEVLRISWIDMVVYRDHALVQVERTVVAILETPKVERRCLFIEVEWRAGNRRAIDLDLVG